MNTIIHDIEIDRASVAEVIAEKQQYAVKVWSMKEGTGYVIDNARSNIFMSYQEAMQYVRSIQQ